MCLKKGVNKILIKKEQKPPLSFDRCVRSHPFASLAKQLKNLGKNTSKEHLKERPV